MLPRRATMMPQEYPSEPPSARTIAEVQPAPRSRRLLTLRFDDGSVLTVPRRDADHAGAGPGVTLLPAAIASMQEAESSTAEHFATCRLGSAERTAQELRDYLRSHGFSPGGIEHAIEALANAGFLDDERAAAQHVYLRAGRKPRSRRMLRAELLRRGIGEGAAEAALGEVDEEAAARELVARQVRRAPRDSYEAFRDSLGRLLLRRGYPYALSQRVIGDAWKDLGEGPAGSDS